MSRQVYYRRIRSAAEHCDTAGKAVDLVIGIRKRMPRIGTRKLYHILHDELSALGVGRDKLFSIMRANHMEIKSARSYRTTTDSHHRFRKHKNRIIDLVPSRPEQVWASDITYLDNRDNHSYLALITDVYSKRIVGYDLSTTSEPKKF